jgi:hypothetical protein
MLFYEKKYRREDKVTSITFFKEIKKKKGERSGRN